MLHGRYDAVVDMKVGTANRAGGHLDDGIMRMLDLGIRNIVAAHIAFAVPSQCLHGVTSSFEIDPVSGSGGLKHSAVPPGQKSPGYWLACFCKLCAVVKCFSSVGS